LKHYFRGSDASNVYDEEPREDELEFSDDEAEREHKRTLKDKLVRFATRRQQKLTFLFRRAGIDPASRQITPMPSHTRAPDLDDLYGASPYDYVYNDMDVEAGPSRPAPKAYDDPYSDSYGLPDSSVLSGSKSGAEPNADSPNGFAPDRSHDRGRGRGKAPTRDGTMRDRGRGRGRDRPRDRGRGRGQGRGRGTNVSKEYWGSDVQHQGINALSGSDSRPARPLSPTSAAIARATGQYHNGAGFQTQQSSIDSSPAGPADHGWGYQQYPSHADYSSGYQQPMVQPHINPRFASRFGLGIAYGQSVHFAGYGQYGINYAADTHVPSGEWVGEKSSEDSAHDDDSHVHPKQ
jgi:H/ACA ribonucleoprotein complex non-core subunit NAF1